MSAVTTADAQAPSGAATLEDALYDGPDATSLRLFPVLCRLPSGNSGEGLTFIVLIGQCLYDPDMATDPF